ncbi:MAG: hypothetical protein AUG51_02455 [Acidobacteria bacterium 13_1_20CM_3_53_8]|nr:MAG: hypothetical protein AUG51_02455 [Acidobacteria bacterium 13_1_20CM_3_53_8]
MKRVLSALASGIAITFLPLFALVVLKVFRYSDPSDKTTILIVLWPMVITWFVLPRSTPMIVNIVVGIIFTVLLYSSVIYLLLRWRGKP